MLKGKSKIQLFDAATGEKLLEQSDENLVTNALDVLLNSKDTMGLLRWWRETGSSGGLIPYVTEHIVTTPAYAMMPLAKRALGGVILWDNNITEDPSITVPPSGVYEVGHAGAEYMGTNAYRGSYNTNESGEIEGGWRHVWDFATDKANGTIKCLSLTSRHAGTVGLHSLYDEDKFPLFNHCFFHTDNLYTATTSSYHGIMFEGEDDKGSILYMKKNGDGRVKLLKRFRTKMWYINADISRVGLKNTAPVITSREELPVTLINDYSCVYVYQGKIHELGLTSTKNLRHRTFDLNTGGELSSRDIALPFAYAEANMGNPAIYREGKYYCFPTASNRSPKTMITLNEQGEQIDSKNTNYFYYMYPPVIDEFSGNILLYTTNTDGTSFANGNGCIPMVLRPDGSISSMCTGTYPAVNNTGWATSNMLYSQFIKTDDMNSPFLYFSDAGYAANIVPVVNSAYIATINNLQTPIVKTAAQTMKITYEIYDE